MSYCSIFFRASSRIARDVEERPVQEARIAVIAERGVLPFLEGRHEAHAVAVLGHVREAALAQHRRIGPRRRPEIGSPWRMTSPDGRVADAGEHLEQLRLAVAGDAGDADDLAGAHLEGDVGEAAHALLVDVARGS